MKTSSSLIRQRAIEDLVSIKARKLHNLRIEYVVRALKGIPDFLEIGSGEGFCTRSIVHWSGHKFDKVEGFDLDGDRVEKARRSWTDEGVIRYKKADAQKPFPYETGSFSAVVLLDILEHVPDPAFVIKEAVRVLKPRGIFFLVVPCEGETFTLHRMLHNRYHWQGSKLYGGHVQRFVKKEVFGLLKDFHLRPQWVRYSCHWLGQVTDVMGFEIKRFHQKSQESKLTGHEKIRQWIYKKLVKQLMQKTAYVESKMFSRFGFGAMDLNVSCIKDAERS